MQVIHPPISVERLLRLTPFFASEDHSNGSDVRRLVEIKAEGTSKSVYVFGSEAVFPMDRLEAYTVEEAEEKAIGTLSSRCQKLNGKLISHEMGESEIKDYDYPYDVEFKASVVVHGTCETPARLSFRQGILLWFYKSDRDRDASQGKTIPFDTITFLHDSDTGTFFHLIERQLERFRGYSEKLKPSMVKSFIENYYSLPSTGYNRAVNFLNRGRRLPAGQADAAIYFSYMFDEGKDLPVTSRLRLDEVVRLYRLGKIRRVIVSGVKRRDDPGGTVPSVEYLCNAGIPRDSIIIEDRAENTMENIKYSLNLARENGMRSLVLVSSPYHMERILRYYEIQSKASPSSLDIYWSSYEYSAEETELEVKIVHEVYSILRDHYSHGNALRSSIWAISQPEPQKSL